MPWMIQANVIKEHKLKIQIFPTSKGEHFLSWSLQMSKNSLYNFLYGFIVLVDSKHLIFFEIYLGIPLLPLVDGLLNDRIYTLWAL